VPFSQEQADAGCNFFECLLKHTADDWWGKPFILCPWQEEGIAHIFGPRDDDGRQLVSMAYFEVPKKSGKTEFAAGLVLLALALDPNPGCQVYGAAASQRQAMNVYRAACKMVEQSPMLKKHLRLLRGTNRILKRSDPDSFYAAIAADGDLTDGVNPSFVVADEVHRWRTRKQIENWDVLSKGGITRRHTLTIGITTAGVQNESPLAWRLHEKTKRIQEGVVQDPTFYGRIYAADKTDDWTKEETWIKANPSLKDNGGFLDIAKYREQYASTQSDPEAQASFKRYFLNLWDQKENRAIDMNRWDACPMPWRAAGLLQKQPEDKVCPLPKELLKHFIERRCWAGIDLSMSTDMSAVALVFPYELPGPWPQGVLPEQGYDVLPFFWIPEDGITKREQRDGMPYRRWAEEGFLELCDGKAIDYRDVEARLKWADEMFDLQEMCFDPWNSRQISLMLVDEGYKCCEIRQGLQTLSEPSKKLLELVATGKLQHGGHPVLRWNASCASAKWNNDNMMFEKPDRLRNSTRIDGISATVDALSQALRARPKFRRSIFDTGPVVV